MDYSPQLLVYACISNAHGDTHRDPDSSLAFALAAGATVRNWHCSGLVLAALGTSLVGWANTEPVSVPAPQQVASGVWIIPGGMLPNRQPDGNSVVFDAPAGLIVVDTGRHRWQRDAILSLASTHQKKIIAIVNSHWHLDHVSGNPDLRAAYPGLRVYASNAIDGALIGFLASSATEATQYLDDPNIAADMREDIRGDLLTIQNGVALKPDVVIAESGSIALGGLDLRINLAPNAATAGDVWLYDETRRVAALGDLITLPAPFLDTACPDGWHGALQQVLATPFKVAIPGHGAPLTHAQVQIYSDALKAFVDCSRSASPEQECANRWADSIQPLLRDKTLEGQQAREMAAYYAGMLRANGGRSQYCESSSGMH